MTTSKLLCSCVTEIVGIIMLFFVVRLILTIVVQVLAKGARLSVR
jgi:hypothetical protein